MAHVSSGTYEAPTITSSDVPGLLGLMSLTKKRAIIDCQKRQLHFVGPGDYDLETTLPAGTESFQCEISPSGHMVLPCSEFSKTEEEWYEECSWCGSTEHRRARSAEAEEYRKHPFHHCFVEGEIIECPELLGDLAYARDMHGIVGPSVCPRCNEKNQHPIYRCPYVQGHGSNKIPNKAKSEVEEDLVPPTATGSSSSTARPKRWPWQALAKSLQGGRKHDS